MSESVLLRAGSEGRRASPAFGNDG